MILSEIESPSSFGEPHHVGWAYSPTDPSASRETVGEYAQFYALAFIRRVRMSGME